MQAIRYYDEGFRLGFLVNEAVAYNHILVINSGIPRLQIRKYPKDQPLQQVAYPAGKALTTLRRIAREAGLDSLSKPVKKALYPDRYKGGSV